MNDSILSSNLPVKYKTYVFFLRWITAWATLLSGFLAVISLGMYWSGLQFRATGYQYKTFFKLLGKYDDIDKYVPPN